VKASTLTYSGKSVAARKNLEMERTDIATLKFCSELYKELLQVMPCWAWQPVAYRG